MKPVPSLDLAQVLDHTHDLWDELHGQRIFITGGAGFLGCWLPESQIVANDRLHLGTSTVVLNGKSGTIPIHPQL